MKRHTIAWPLFGAAFIGILAVPLIPAVAQTSQERIDELRRQIEDLEHQASQYRDNIASERTKGNSLKQEISVLKNQINGLEAQITLTGKKIDTTKIEIGDLEDKIFAAQEDIREQKQSIGRIILFFHRQDRENLLVSLLKNKNLSDFFRQGQYAGTINAQLVSLVGQLQAAEDSLRGNKQDLEGKKHQLEAYHQEQVAKKESLDDAKQAKNLLLTQTKGQEAAYQRMLNSVERQEAAFFSELRTLESNVIAGGLYIVHVQATGLPPRGTKLFQLPMENARMTQGYGMTTYARRGGYGGAPHNGVDYAVGYGTPIKAIGDGIIIANGSNDGWGNWVAIQHPDHYNLVSLYGHMSALSPLLAGTKIRAGDVIGYEGNTGHVTGSHLHLSLYKDFFTYVNDKKGQLYFNYFEGSLNPFDYL